MPKRICFLALLIGAALLALAVACKDEEGGAPAPAGGPSLEITSPGEGDTVSAGDLTVEVDVSGFEVVDQLIGITPACPNSTACPNEPGKGHVHYYLLDPDGAVPTTPGQAAITDVGTYHPVATTSFTLSDVGPGTYKVAAQLVNNDHTPLSPAVVDEIEVKVTGSGGAGGAASTPRPGY